MQKKYVDFEKVTLLDGFWKERYDLNKEVSVPAVFDRFKETDRFASMLFHFDEKEQLHIFYDSDVAKWIEAVSYLIIKGEKLPEYEKLIDDIAEAIDKNNLNGYIDSYFIQRSPENIFTDRYCHELYCLGHMTEAAIAYDRATGKGLLLRLCENAVEHAIRAFVTEKTAKFYTGGHEEIELALVKLYRYTKKKKYLDLCMHFLNERGRHGEILVEGFLPRYDQSDKPVRELDEAQGHAVRLLYLCIALADAAAETEDGELMRAAERLFDSIAQKRMYITGGTGSESESEGFTSDYDLPNLHAYSESCAAIGLALFSLSMQQSHAETKYSDVIERVLYNSMLSSTSADGKSFFYENPLEISLSEKNKESNLSARRHFPQTRRQEIFECSCCPPNINRIFARIADFIYSEGEDGLYIWQYIASRYENGDRKISMFTDFPINGKIKIESEGISKIYLRKPSWCEFVAADAEYREENGYLLFENVSEIHVDFGMPMYFAEANPAVRADNGKVAIMRGPVVYCAEQTDNAAPLGSLALDVSAPISEEWEGERFLPRLSVPAYRDKPCAALYRKAEKGAEETVLHLIPYYRFANREECDMRVFIRKA